MTVFLGPLSTSRRWPRLREQPQRIADKEFDVSEHIHPVYLYTILG